MSTKVDGDSVSLASPLDSRAKIDDSGKDYVEELSVLTSSSKLVAIGEVGLDYHYKPYDKKAQIELFEVQLQLARDVDLPVAFHVREAYEDFWPVVDNFPGIRGVLHSFSDNLKNLSKGLARGFYVGVNGIATYKKTPEQAEAFASVPLEKMLLETDAPYLTPSAKRGIMNEPTYVGLVLEWVAKHCGKSPEEVATTTARNTEELFKLHERARESSSSRTDTGPTGTYRHTSAG
jgi:TatD DNase family protein